LKGFKQFLLRGNVIELAVAVVMGAAFGAVVTAFVKGLITPLIAAIIGHRKRSFMAMTIAAGAAVPQARNRNQYRSTPVLLRFRDVERVGVSRSPARDVRWA
jgi:large-conductance mechanosensitive channel